MSPSTSFPPREPGTAPLRVLIAVLYRQAGLIALCALVGSAASLVLHLRQMRVDASAARWWTQTQIRPGAAASRATPYSDPVDRKVETQPASRSIESQLALARDDLRQSEDRIVALLVQAGDRTGRSADDAAAGTGQVGDAPGAAEGVLKLELDLDVARQPPDDGAGNARNLDLQLAGSPQRLARTVRENTPLGAELNRLERARRLAHERFAALQGQLDQIDLTLRLNPPEAGRHVIGDAPDHPAATAGRKAKIVDGLGLLTGLLLGLTLAARRELGGARMRSPREAERALGAPVLGAIPTLSARARDACFGPPTGGRNA